MTRAESQGSKANTGQSETSENPTTAADRQQRTTPQTRLLQTLQIGPRAGSNRGLFST